VVAESEISLRIPKLLARTGATEFLEAPSPLPGNCTTFESQPCGRVPAPLEAEEFDTVGYPHEDEMVWVRGRCWWFPERQISAESQFEWKNGRAYLLEPDGSAVEGIVFAGGVAPD
jgi:hypothetical protein